MEFLIGLLQVIEGLSGYTYIKASISKLRVFKNKSSGFLSIIALLISALLIFVFFVIILQLYLHFEV